MELCLSTSRGSLMFIPGTPARVFKRMTAVLGTTKVSYNCPFGKDSPASDDYTLIIRNAAIDSY